MSHHSTGVSATTLGTTTATAMEDSSSKHGSSATGSLKRQKNKDIEIPLTDDFVLMSTPEKFMDKNVNESNVVNRHRTDLSPNDKINLECLLLSDTSEQCGTPQHVENLLKHFESIQLRQSEILFLLVYIVALESGFIGHSDYEQAKLHLHCLSAASSFHAKNVLHLSHLKPNFNITADKTRFIMKLQSFIDSEHESDDYLYALLTGLVVGDLFVVTLSPATSTGAEGFSTCLSIGRYVLSMQAKNKPLYLRFRKLNELSNILRDELFVPMRCQHISWLECCIYPSLDGMPPELYDHILKYLSKNQLKCLANVNKTLYNLTTNSRFMQQSMMSLTCSTDGV